VFCDVDSRTHNLDPARVEDLITERTSGIVGVHLWGRPCAIDELTALAERPRPRASLRRGARVRLLAAGA